jgi:hypothetical protein
MYMQLTIALSLAALASMFLIASCGMAPIDAADTIYLGADIITMVDVQPSAEALAVKGSAILAVGKRADIEKTDMGEATKVVALGGTALLPASSTRTATTTTRFWSPTRQSSRLHRPAPAKTLRASSPH